MPWPECMASLVIFFEMEQVGRESKLLKAAVLLLVDFFLVIDLMFSTV